MIVKADPDISSHKLLVTALKDEDASTRGYTLSKVQDQRDQLIDLRNYVFLDLERRYCCKFRLMTDTHRVEITLFPEGAPHKQLMLLMLVTLEALLLDHPDKEDWIAFGRMGATRGAVLAEWNQYVDVTNLERFSDESWEIRAPLGPLVRNMRRLRDDLSS